MNKSIQQLVELDKQHFLHQTLPIQQQQQYSFQVTQAEKQFSSLWCHCNLMENFYQRLQWERMAYEWTNLQLIFPFINMNLFQASFFPYYLFLFFLKLTLLQVKK